jgi:hypothetical protein
MEPLQVLRLVITALDKLGISSMLVGSFASASHGVPRLTQDADLLVRLDEEHVDALIEAFSGEFYLDRGQIERALADRSSFNLIHLDSSFKIDLFVWHKGGYVEEEFSRRIVKQIDSRTGFAVYVQTPEDALLSKLDWYKRGGEVSENQWRDVIGILKVQAGRLDTDYLEKWAKELGVSEHLQRARREAAR